MCIYIYIHNVQSIEDIQDKDLLQRLEDEANLYLDSTSLVTFIRNLKLHKNPLLITIIPKQVGKRLLQNVNSLA